MCKKKKPDDGHCRPKYVVYYKQQNTTSILKTVVYIDYQKNPLVYTHNGDDSLSSHAQLTSVLCHRLQLRLPS